MQDFDPKLLRMSLPSRTASEREMDLVSVGRTREIGWRQVCRDVAASGRRPGKRQGRRWISVP